MNVLDKRKKNTFNSDLVQSEPETQEATGITAIVANIAPIFVWQNNSLYEKILRLGAYMLLSFPKSALNWTKTGSETDPAEYVPSLNRKTKWFSPSNNDLKTGDFVWIVEPASPWAYYLLARVVELNFGSDAIARSTDVRTASGNLIHPVVKLASVLPVSVSEYKTVFINGNLRSKLA